MELKFSPVLDERNVPQLSPLTSYYSTVLSTLADKCIPKWQAGLKLTPGEVKWVCKYC